MTLPDYYTELAPFRGLFQEGHPILCYHKIALPPKRARIKGLYLEPKLFLRQMSEITQAGLTYSFLGCSAVSQKDTITITFDDGYTDALTVIAPLLCARQIPFHVFVSSARMNGTDRKYLSPAQMVELSNMPGVSIGAHGATHRSLTSLTSSELDAELQASKVDLETVLQKPVTTMSYPYGHVDDSVRKAAHDAGFALAATSKWGFNEAASDPLLQRRIDMWSGDTKRTVEHKILGHWNWFGLLT
jgi:peptidoglycan/xylan/chitin deacetylase (PgdA/CDA1 family)